MKALKLARMMEAHGYGVTLYAAEGPSDFHNTVGCVPDPGPAHVVEPKWTTEYFREMNARAIAAIQERAQPRDLILLTTGWPQKPIADFFGAEHQVVEYGIGYEGVFAPFRVFESYAWMQTVYGRDAGMTGESAMSKQGRFYDAVIPNYFEVDQFPAGTGDGGYLLFLGRLIESKGLRVAIDAAKRAGLPLVVAGQGNPEEFGLSEEDEEGAPLYVGVADPQYRAALMGGAIAILCPSLYLEPFGGAAVEAQMCGTPAITTDWGAYPETVEEGVSGFRCRTMAEFDAAVEAAPGLSREKIRERAIRLYSTEAVAAQYDRYFKRLADLYEDGFYQVRPIGRTSEEAG
jgi:glycosyltransferase involved in cell wall biosynthesis